MKSENERPSEWGPSEWLELLMRCQDGGATCMRVMEVIEERTVPVECAERWSEQLLELCHRIERLPASEEQTVLSLRASKLFHEVQALTRKESHGSGT